MKRCITLLLLAALSAVSCGTSGQYSFGQRFYDGIYYRPAQTEVVELYTEEDFAAMAARNIAQAKRDTVLIVPEKDNKVDINIYYVNPHATWLGLGVGFGRYRYGSIFWDSYYWDRYYWGSPYYWHSYHYWDPWYYGYHSPWGYGSWYYDRWYYDRWYYGGWNPYRYGWYTSRPYPAPHHINPEHRYSPVYNTVAGGRPAHSGGAASISSSRSLPASGIGSGARRSAPVVNGRSSGASAAPSSRSGIINRSGSVDASRASGSGAASSSRSSAASRTGSGSGSSSAGSVSRSPSPSSGSSSGASRSSGGSSSSGSSSGNSRGGGGGRR